MLWKGAALTRREDFADAMAELIDAADAAAFRLIFADAFPDRTDLLLGYLIGDCPEEDNPRIEQLLGVTYPFKNLAPFARLAVGYAIGSTDPALVAFLTQIPRREALPT